MRDDAAATPWPGVPRIASADQRLDRMLARRVGLTPDAPFIRFERGERISYRDFTERAFDLAFALERHGVCAGERVVTLGANSIDAVLLWFAIELLGAIDCPVNPAFTGEPLRHAVDLVQARWLVAAPQLLAQLDALDAKRDDDARALAWPPAPGLPSKVRGLPLAPLIAIAGERPADWQPCGACASDLCAILFTSGTTGPAKGAMVTHAMACTTAMQTAEGLRIGPGDTVYCAHPLFHMSPRFCAFYAAMLTGAQVTFDARFEAARWLDRIRESSATLTIGHGPLLEMIFAQPPRDDDADTKLTRIGTSPFPKHIAADFERRFGVKGIETWGMTEVNIPCWHPWDEPLRAGSCGRIRSDDYEFAVVDPESDEPLPASSVGEFVVRPRRPWIVSPGYWGDAEATAKAWRNLWFHTGDSGYIDADGWVWFVDRLGDRIRRRAENISSFDIETAARAEPRVLEAAAVGVPSGYASDDDIKLCVVPRPDATLAPAELLAFLAQRLPHHMVPRYIEVMPTLPRTPTQKVRKAQLRADGVGPSTWDRKAEGISLRELAGS
ncbi:MAG: AMP-binding protein [Ideonella sp.]|nr:AMP-binding protein [Ideonella sp.]